MTSIDWLINQIKEDQTIRAKSMSEWSTVFKKAKEMEKEQIMDGFINGDKTDCMEHEDICVYAEQYYNETFKSE